MNCISMTPAVVVVVAVVDQSCLVDEASVLPVGCITGQASLVADHLRKCLT